MCLGRVDPTTGEIVPSKRKNNIDRRAVSAPGVTVTSRVAGPCLLLGELSKKHGIDALLKQCFPEDHKLILSLVYYIIHKGNALHRTESWSVSNLHPFEETITSQRISELLSRLSEDSRQHFLSLSLSLSGLIMSGRMTGFAMTLHRSRPMHGTTSIPITVTTATANPLSRSARQCFSDSHIACQLITVACRGLCQNAPLARMRRWRKNLKCSCTICTLRFQNFSPPCLQTKSIILTHPLDSDTAPH